MSISILEKCIIISTENCGGVPYDLVKSICCMGSILDRDESYAKCCSKEYISIPPPGPSSTHNPHGGIPPIDKPPRVYNSRTHVRFSFVNSILILLGLLLYDITIIFTVPYLLYQYISIYCESLMIIFIIFTF